MTAKTDREINSLVANWCADPCWDLEDTEGFEDYHDQLLAIRLDMETFWRLWHEEKVQAKAAELDCSLKLAEYIITLEGRLDALEQKNEQAHEQLWGRLPPPANG